MTFDDDKVDVAHREHAPIEEDALPPSGSPERIRAEKALVRKLDCRLLPIVFLIFIMNYIDVRAKGVAGNDTDWRRRGKPLLQHD